MPRAFLVKKPCVSTCKRNWSELPDEERGEIYVPGEVRPRRRPPTGAVPAHPGPSADLRPPEARLTRGWGGAGAEGPGGPPTPTGELPPANGLVPGDPPLRAINPGSPDV